jgi:hypothetical protein
LAATISTHVAAPVIGRDAAAGRQDRLRQGRRTDGRPTRGYRPRRRVTCTILVRGDSAQFSLVLTENTTVSPAIETIPDHAWTPVRYPGVVRDPDAGA